MYLAHSNIIKPSQPKVKEPSAREQRVDRWIAVQRRKQQAQFFKDFAEDIAAIKRVRPDFEITF